MDAVLHAIAEFLKLNARTGFALFAAGVSMWLLRRYDVVAKDDAVALGIAYVACFGLFVWLIYLAEKIGGFLVGSLANHARARAASANLRLLQPSEHEALAWIHHKRLSRIRADQRNATIHALERMGLLQVADYAQGHHDRVFIVPDFVLHSMMLQLGKPEPDSVGHAPP